jgi:hypothetical protein
MNGIILVLIFRRQGFLYNIGLENLLTAILGFELDTD